MEAVDQCTSLLHFAGFVHVTTETVARPSGLSDQLVFASKTLHD